MAHVSAKLQHKNRALLRFLCSCFVFCASRVNGESNDPCYAAYTTKDDCVSLASDGCVWYEEENGLNPKCFYRADVDNENVAGDWCNKDVGNDKMKCFALASRGCAWAVERETCYMYPPRSYDHERKDVDERLNKLGRVEGVCSESSGKKECESKAVQGCAWWEDEVGLNQKCYHRDDADKTTKGGKGRGNKETDRDYVKCLASKGCAWDPARETCYESRDADRQDKGFSERGDRFGRKEDMDVDDRHGSDSENDFDERPVRPRTDRPGPGPGHGPGPDRGPGPGRGPGPERHDRFESSSGKDLNERYERSGTDADGRDKRMPQRVQEGKDDRYNREKIGSTKMGSDRCRQGVDHKREDTIAVEIIAIAVLAVVAVCTLMCSIGILLWNCRRRGQSKKSSDVVGQVMGIPVQQDKPCKKK